MGKVPGNQDENFERLMRELDRRAGGQERVRVEALRAVGAAGQPAYANGWVVYSTYTVSFYRDLSGNIRLLGRTASGTLGQAAFTLPAGYRPLVERAFAVAHAGGTGVVTVTAAGLVIPGASCSTVWTALDGIAFRVEQ